MEIQKSHFLIFSKNLTLPKRMVPVQFTMWTDNGYFEISNAFAFNSNPLLYFEVIISVVKPNLLCIAKKCCF